MQRGKIVVISLGGTIAMVEAKGPGVVPGLDASDLVAAIPGLDRIADIECVAFSKVGSNDLTYDAIATLSQVIRRHFEQGAAGVVVCQGTGTLEEAAFLLDLLLEDDKPVVVTGALRNPTLPGPDGPANLLNAVRVAAHPAARGLGVLVVMDDEVHAARFVRKTHTHKASAFSSPTVGPIGWTVEDRVRIVLRPASRTPTIPWCGTPPFVPALVIPFGCEPALVQAIAGQNPKGLVVGATGSGAVPTPLLAEFEALAKRIPVILTSRIGAGEANRCTYSYSGSEMDLLGRGLLPGNFLDLLKSRLMLGMLIAAGADRTSIRTAFEWH